MVKMSAENMETCRTILPPSVRLSIQQWLQEDLLYGDVTSSSMVGHYPTHPVQANVRAREPLVLSGLVVAQAILREMVWLWYDTPLHQDVSGLPQSMEPNKPQQLMAFKPAHYDGDWVLGGSLIATITAPAVLILQTERTLLNVLQHLCGIATTTRQFVQAVEGTSARIVHTRKTTPGLRYLEHQAVLHGGGSPHRLNLGQAAMVKDNHLDFAALRSQVDLATHVSQIRSRLSHLSRIEVECDTLEQVKAALGCGVEVILLDNMPLPVLQQAVDLIRQSAHGDHVLIEASGGVTLESVRQIAETGVDFISTSQITLGAPAVDIGLDIELQPASPVGIGLSGSVGGNTLKMGTPKTQSKENASAGRSKDAYP